MEETKKERLIRKINNAINLEYDYFGVLVQIDENDRPELIIDYTENFEDKKNYYKAAYDDELRLTFNEDIKIIGYIGTNSFEDFLYPVLLKDNKRGDE